MKITSIEEMRAKKQPHTSGRCVCLGCKKDWVAVVPVGVDVVECPHCGLYKGVRDGLCVRTDESHFTCTCGNDFLFLVRSGCYCPVCATAFSIDDVYDAP